MASILNYDVRINGVIYTTTSLTSVLVTGRAPSTNYTCEVRSRDTAGNVSGWSSPLVVTTSAAPADTTAPSTPTGLTITNVTTNSATVTWTASTDNIGVTKYQVEVNSVVGGDESTTLTRNLASLTESTGYTVRVRAGDAAGNWSSWASTSFTTSASGSIPAPLSAWFFTAGTGTVAVDSYGGRDITITTDNWATGYDGPGIVYRGSQSAIPIIPNSAGLQTANRTLAFWVRRIVATPGWWVQCYVTSMDSASWGIGEIGSQLYMRGKVGGANTNLAYTLPALEEWHHVALTYNGATLKAYMDGTLLGSSPLTGTIDFADTVAMQDTLNGVIDEVRFYNVALDASQINTIKGQRS